MDSKEKELNGFNNEEEATVGMTEEAAAEALEETAGEEDAVITEEAAPEVGEQEAADDFAENEAEVCDEDGNEAEYTQDPSEELTDADSEADTDENGEIGDVSEALEEPEKKKSAAPVIALIVVIAAAIILIAYLLFSDSFGGNKYNKLGYVNVSGRTVQDIADEAGIELKDFLSEYGLPEDMPGDTTEIAAIYSMPAKMYLQTMIGMDDFEALKTELNIPDETTPNTPKTFIDKIKSVFVKDKIQPIDENTPWYIVEGELTINDYSGGAVEQFKEFYGLGDEVTGETKMKEIQDKINEKTNALLVEQEAANNAEPEAEEGSAEDSADNGEAPEGEPAEDASAEAESGQEAAE
jgi:hypothetical protein